MKKLFKFICTTSLILTVVTGVAQTTFNGKVTDQSGAPIAGVNVILKGTEKVVYTDSIGSFTIEANVGDILQIIFIGYTTVEFKIKESTESEIIIALEEDNSALSEVVVAGFSSYSSWVGATLAYNLDGKDPDNVIAAAKVRINTVKKFTGKFRLSTVGNISKPNGTIDTTAISKDIRAVSQSTQGLSVGLEPLYTIISKQDFDIRAWSTINYKLNIFKTDVDGTSENVNLSQFRFTMGLEFDGFEFSDGGKRIHIGIEGSITTFDTATYKKIFNESKNSLYSLEWTIVVPLFSNFGMIVGQTLTKGIKPVFGAGIIVAAAR